MTTCLPLDQLDLVVQPFHPATARVLDDVVGLGGVTERICTVQTIGHQIEVLRLYKVGNPVITIILAAL
ncbi:MAG: hypothetical protein M3Z04_14695 [Chloroflexota bacterium]|nr:hypothetical protein [Chloroflexota bacterium]